jgi:hypothetical protein
MSGLETTLACCKAFLREKVLNFELLQHIGANFITVSRDMQERVLGRLFAFLYSGVLAKHEMDSQVLACILGITGSQDFLDLELTISGNYSWLFELVFLTPPDISSQLLVICSGLVAKSDELRADPLIVQLSSRILVAKGRQLDCLVLCTSFLYGPPFPSALFLALLCNYVLAVLRREFPHSILHALHFVSLCLENLGAFDFSPYLELIGDLIHSPDLEIATSVTRILFLVQHFDHAIFDLLLERAKLLNFLNPGQAEKEYLVNLAILVIRFRESLAEKSDSILPFLTMMCSSMCFDVSFAAVGSVLTLLPITPAFSPDLCDFLLKYYDQDVNTTRIFNILIQWFEIGGAVLEQCMLKLSQIIDEMLDFLWASDYPEHQLFLKYLEVIMDQTA